MAACPSSARIVSQGQVRREGPQLVPHAMAFPSAMMSLRVLLGGEHRLHTLSAHGREWRSDEDYFLHLGLSGEGFRFLFDTAEYLRFQEEDGAQPILDCFAAEAIPVSVWAARPAAGVAGVWQDESALRTLVIDTLAQGCPALVLGRTGSDWVLLATGYEDGGGTLVAWTFAPGADLSNKSFSPEDCQYVRDWARGVDGVALVTGTPGDPVDRAPILRRALARGERFLRRAEGHPHGDPVDWYREWQGRLKDDAFWRGPFSGRPAVDPEIWDLAERRAFCAEFLEGAGEALGTGALAPAVDAFREIHDLMWRIHHLCDGTHTDGEHVARALRDAAVRREILGILKDCRDRDERAADAIAQVLAETA